jgi:thiol-disulfide isomerase/thioredoxin
MDGLVFIDKSDLNQDGSLRLAGTPFVGKKIICMLFADWCPHCKSSKPEFAQLANNLSNDPNMACLFLDVTAEPEVATKFAELTGTRGVPQFLLFVPQGDKAVFAKVHDGPRNSQGYMQSLQSV